MCQPPFKHEQWDAASETPTGFRTHARDGTWVHEDVPLHLHVFEYIVRNALLDWWRQMAKPT